MVRGALDPTRWSAYAEAMRRGAYFAAHEILEDSWRVSRDQREQALIWIAAAFVHWQRGRPAGVERLLAKVADRLATTGAAEPLRDRVARWRRAAQDGLPCPGLGEADVELAVAWARQAEGGGRMGPSRPDTS